jgi:lysophospholipase L1-like esterase
VEWYQAEVRDLEGRIAQRGLKRPIVFYGSSSIRLWTTLAEDIGSEQVLNLGFGGSTLEACVYFFDRLVTAARPSSLVVYAGDNDLGDGRTPDMVLGYFRALAGKVAAVLPDIPFSFISIKPSPARAGILERIVQTNGSIAAAIAQQPNAHYIDVFPAMLGADGKPRTELFQADGLHLSAEGYRLWTEIVLERRDLIYTQEFFRQHPRE